MTEETTEEIPRSRLPNMEREDGPLLEGLSDSNNVKVGDGFRGQYDSIESQDDGEMASDVKNLPKIIRDSVPLEDDPSIPVLTFRYFLLSVVFIAPGAFIDTVNSFRTTSAPYSIFFVQIASHWAGLWLAKVLPKKCVSVFGYKIDLNPGPWSIKETAMVTITANSGATGNMATSAISLADLYFGVQVSPFVALPFMWSIVFVGYSYAAIAKDLLLYDPEYTWPQALMQTTLFQSQEKSGKSEEGKKQMKVFFVVLVAICSWQFLPEFLFPFTSSLAILCWIAPYNETVNFIGSGLGGMGFLNISLDWANITSSIMLYPYWIQVIQFIAFVLAAYILIPLVKFTDVVSLKHGLMSNGLFLANGKMYPTNELLTEDLKLDQAAYERLGPVYLGAQRVWNMFFGYAAYSSGIVWVVLFGLPKFKATFKNFGTSKIYTDRLNKINSAYPDVPKTWYIGMFLCSFTTLSVIFLTGNMFMPWWCCVIALAMGSIIVTPLAWLYALSNFQLAIGTFNELVYGYLIQNTSHKHPVGALVFGCISGNAWYRAQYHLECMKLAFYNHLPPRAVFFSQLFGEVIGIPINYLALNWVLKTKRHYIDGSKVDPLHQWTAQEIASSHTNAIQYVVLGPERLFTRFPYLPYGFIVGIVTPAILYALHHRYPNSRLNFNLWNTTVFFSSMSNFYGNISSGYLSRFIGGTITMYWGYRYRFALWKRYNYILAAAFDTGYNLSTLLIFLLFSVFFSIEMPNWWGNNDKSVERCFAL